MEPLSRWRHYKGGLYTLIAMCRLESTLEPHVIYKVADPEADGDDVYGEYWCRPLTEWHEEVSPGVRRFTKEST